MNDAAKYEFFDGVEGMDRDFREDQTHRRVARPHGLRDDDLQCAAEEVPDVRDRRRQHRAGYFNTYILESDRITGPFKLVQYLHHFGEQAYFVNIPSKFISANGRTLWLCYSANFFELPSNPPGSRYGMCLQEIKLQTP